MTKISINNQSDNETNIVVNSDNTYVFIKCVQNQYFEFIETVVNPGPPFLFHNWFCGLFYK